MEECMPKKKQDNNKCGKDKSPHLPMTHKDSDGRMIKICKKCGKKIKD